MVATASAEYFRTPEHQSDVLQMTTDLAVMCGQMMADPNVKPTKLDITRMWSATSPDGLTLTYITNQPDAIPTPSNPWPNKQNVIIVRKDDHEVRIRYGTTIGKDKKVITGPLFGVTRQNQVNDNPGLDAVRATFSKIFPPTDTGPRFDKGKLV